MKSKVELTSATMEYDSANRLIKYNGQDVRYDADGNMTYGPLDGVMTELVYDCRNRLVRAGNTVYVYDAEDNRIAVQNNKSRTEYTIENNIGSTTAITDAQGKLIRVYSYGTYGELLSGDTSGIKFLYNGRFGVITDENSLYYMRARYYNVDIKWVGASEVCV